MPLKFYFLGAAAVALATVFGMQAWDIHNLKASAKADTTTIADLNVSNASLTAANAELNKAKLSVEDISAASAKACASSVKFRLNAQTESKVISNATDDDAAAHAYDQLLCLRPEARGNSHCPAAPAGAAPG